MTGTTLRLHGYWRSTASFRVRIALNLKGVAYEQVTHDLRAGEQRRPGYLAISPQGLVPAIEAGGVVITQSLAILEWLEECYPDPPLLPRGPDARASVRAMASLIACDVHPLNNLRVLRDLRTRFAADDAQVDGWMAHWMHEGFAALEQLITKHGGAFAFGDEAGMADCLIAPQVYSARRFNVPLEPYPRLVAAADRAALSPAFADAHPDNQPDADRS